MVRILLVSGKGGVGKTTVAAATALLAARRGHRTLTLSIDPAHGLADVLDGTAGLFAAAADRPTKVDHNLDVQATANVLEGLVALGQHVAEARYDLVVVDGPSAIDLVRRLEAAEGVSPRHDGALEVLRDHHITTARLVANPEPAVLRETQRALAYLHLHGVAVEGLVMNRVLPEGDGLLGQWAGDQRGHLAAAGRRLQGLPVAQVPALGHQTLGPELLLQVAASIYGDADPASPFSGEPPVRFERQDGAQLLRLRLPGATKRDVRVSRGADDVVVRVGAFERRFSLPASVRRFGATSARIEGSELAVRFEEGRG